MITETETIDQPEKLERSSASKILRVVMWTFLAGGIFVIGMIIYALATFRMTRLW
jgi:hypothetical protein